MYTGPHLIKDNLAFGYDTGYPIVDNNQSSRHSKGEPITNLFTTVGTPSDTDTDVRFSVNGTGTFKRVAVGTKIGNYKVKKTDVVYSYELGENGCHYHGNDYSTVLSGTKVSLNLEYFLTDDVDIETAYLGNFEILSGVGGSWGSISSVTNKWHRVSFTRTATSTGTLRMLMYPGACGGSKLSAKGKIYYKNPTVTLTPHPTLFVDGTRSSIQSLIDLKNKSNIDVSNLSFNSSGQPEFDGTDDIINTGLMGGRNPSSSPFTIEAIVKSDTTSGNHMWLDATNNGSSQRLYCAHASKGSASPMGIQGSGWSHSIPQDTEFHHYVLVMDGSVARLYNNGEPHSTKNYTSYQIQSINVGGRSGYRWVGKIPVFKIHNEIFTADKVKHNFNVYKNRFGI